MNAIAFEVFLIFILLLLNGIFSMSELAVVSARKVRMQKRADEGSAGAKAALELADDPSRFLSTVQIGITLVGILAGAFGGATIAGILAEWFTQAGFPESYSSPAAFALVVATITYFSIVAGELIPKSLALNSPEKIATIVARPMKIVSWLCTPVVLMLTIPTMAVLRLLKVHASVEPPVTDEEIRSLIDEGTKAGVLEEAEQDLMKSVIYLSDQRVTSIMTPRTDVSWIDLYDPIDEIKELLAQNRFSRLPVARGGIDDTVGYVSAKSLLASLIRGEEIDLNASMMKPLYVPESLTNLELLDEFKTSGTHVAIVVDEFGGVEGLVTVNDILEAIVGELKIDKKRASEHAIHRQESRAILDGRTPIQEFKEEFEIKELPGEDRKGYETLAGFVLAHLGKLPKEGESFKWKSFEFEIVEMKRNRIDKIMVRFETEVKTD